MKRGYSWLRQKHLGRNAIDSRYAIIEACIVGFCSALVALSLKQGIGYLGTFRIQATEQFGSFLVLPLAGSILGFLSGWLVENFAPEAAGGGMPQVKAVLAGFPLSCSLRVAIVKLISTILVLGAGFPLGRRGPTVHIGAALANWLSSFIPTSPEHRRQIMAAGAVAGLAASFNTPIAGVLFAIEELLRDVSGLTLKTALLASFIGATVSRLWGFDNSNIGDSFIQSGYFNWELPLFAFLGIFAAVLGTFFNRSILFFHWLSKASKFPLSWRVGAIGCLVGAVIAFLPPSFQNNAGLRDFLLAGEVGWRTTAIVFIPHFFLTALAYGSGVTGGLFAPSLVLGSSLGYLLGTAEVHFWHTGSPYTLAIAGMAAFFTAVVRTPVTALVIVLEISKDFDAVLPLTIAVVVCHTASEAILPRSIYERLLAVRGIDLKESFSNNRLLGELTAGDVMRTSIETLDRHLTVTEARQILSRSSHRGFPVVAGGKLVGIFTQSDLGRLSVDSSEVPLHEVMTPNPIVVTADAPLSDVLYLLDRYQLSRIPITEDDRLIGIITRTDIIRAEVGRIDGSRQLQSTAPASRVVYQTRSLKTGKGRILLPIANPENLQGLLTIAGTIARHHDCELECLHIIKLPAHGFLDRQEMDGLEARKLLRHIEKWGKEKKIAIHTQIRVGTDTFSAIIDAINARPVDRLILGWKGNTSTQEAIFGNIVDRSLLKIPCEIILIKLGKGQNTYPYQISQPCAWLLPTAGGANSQVALQLLPALTSLHHNPASIELILSQVRKDDRQLIDNDDNVLTIAAANLRAKLPQKITTASIYSHSIAAAIIRLAHLRNCQLVILGASREGLLQQAVLGNITEKIACGVDRTTILVRAKL
jgi:CIC family chloride channel protein